MFHMLKISDGFYINTQYIVAVGYDESLDSDIEVIIRSATNDVVVYAKDIGSKVEANQIVEKLIRMIDQ